MPLIKKTIVAPNGKPGEVKTFNVPLGAANKIVGAGVSNECVYNLKKRGRHEVEYSDGSKIIFEVVKPDENPQPNI